jgi:hypothetical protein
MVGGIETSRWEKTRHCPGISCSLKVIFTWEVAGNVWLRDTVRGVSLEQDSGSKQRKLTETAWRNNVDLSIGFIDK